MTSCVRLLRTTFYHAGSRPRKLNGSEKFIILLSGVSARRTKRLVTFRKICAERQGYAGEGGNNNYF